jgi:hypothetical protein
MIYYTNENNEILMKHLFILLIILFTITVNQSNAQGCVAIRSNGNTCSLGKAGDSKGYIFNFNTRYFKSYKHFVGKEEQKHRVEEGTEVINHSLSWDFTLTKMLNKYWSLSVNVPVVSNVRSSMYEHYGNSSLNPNARNNTQSFGIGDIHFTAYRWILDPEKSHKGNLQVGLSIKFATGDYEVTDYFHKLKSNGGDSTVLGPVDQSIQLGDGGTGIALELSGYRNFGARFGVYGNFYYLANPREQNGVSTSRGSATSATNIQYFTSTMSVPDQMMVRGGANYMITKGLTASGGIRFEAIPSSDLIGGDKGFRRPGTVLSVEPTINYMAKKANFYLSVPVVIERNRTQSYSDKLRTAATGTHVQGDAAFADYLINVGFSVHL